MKTLIIAKVPTHHTSRALRGLNLENYKEFGSGVHQAAEDFKTMKEAKAHLNGRDLEEVNIQYLTGCDREEYQDYGYLKF